jgi:hypothetical protein
MLPDLRDLEDLAHLGVAQDLLAQLGREQALGGLLEVVGDVVDDLVRADLDALLLGERAGLARRDDVEPDDDRLGRLGQDHVALGDAADAACSTRRLTSSVLIFSHSA